MAKTQSIKSSPPLVIRSRECYVHRRAHEDLRKRSLPSIRRHLCSLDSDPRQFDGRYYCVFHYPSEEKNIESFRELTEDLFRRVEGILESKNKTDKALESNLDRMMGLVSESEHARGPLMSNRDVDEIIAEDAVYDFRYVWFPSESLFTNYTFLAPVDFSFATFSGPIDFNTSRFKENAEFNSTKFEERVDFRSAIFSELANFDNAIFCAKTNFDRGTFEGEAHFKSTTFLSHASFASTGFKSGVHFDSALFQEESQLLFSQTRFEQYLKLRLAVVRGYLHFEGGQGRFFEGGWLDIKGTQPKFENRFTNVFEHTLDLTNIRAEKPERISFNKVRLRPNWFCNADPRKFTFTDVTWENGFGTHREIEDELKALTKDHDASHCLQLLTISFRNLAANAEEFNRFDDASYFRKAAFECERREKSKKSVFFSRSANNPRRSSATLHRIYRALSVYGESWSWATFVLFCVLIGFGIFYDSPLASFEHPQSTENIYQYSKDDNKKKVYRMNNWEGIVHSLYVAALQRPEPKPADTLTRFAVIAETIFIPLQVALIALALRRKFLR